MTNKFPCLRKNFSLNEFSTQKDSAQGGLSGRNAQTYSPHQNPI